MALQELLENARKRETDAMRIVEHIAKEDEGGLDDFVVVREPTVDQSRSSKPLLIIVHPGDAIETDCGDEDVAEWSSGNMDCMAIELDHMRADTVDIVVAHRTSSLHLNLATDHYRFAILDATDEAAAVLYGDGMEDVGRWVAEKMLVLGGEQRPWIRMTGAYSDKDNGCITACGQALLQVCPDARIEVSPWAPASNAPDSGERWDPSASVAAGRAPRP